MYRKRDYMMEERKKDKQAKKNSWYTKNNYESVMCVPATPQSKLSKLYRQKINESGMKIRVVEKAGRKIKNFLQRLGTVGLQESHTEFPALQQIANSPIMDKPAKTVTAEGENIWMTLS